MSGRDFVQPPIRGWIDVSFHVAAPLRNRAFEVALRALHRGLTAARETDYGYTGNFDLHAVGQPDPVLLRRQRVKGAA